jgi:Stress responsive A/B Barrel Domain
MIQHIVLVRFRPEMTEGDIARLFTELHEIKGKVGGILAITAGKSQSPEQLERGYMHGFVVDFQNWDALQSYQDHPDHKSFGARLVQAAIGGLDGILVFDLPSN